MIACRVQRLHSLPLNRNLFMITLRRFFIAIANLALLLYVGGCGPAFGPAGGSLTHVPPATVDPDKPLTIEIEFSTWGQGPSDISGRFTDVQCWYKVSNQSDYEKVSMPTSGASDKKITFTCSIPPLGKTQATDLFYYISYTYDGDQDTKYTRSAPQKVKIVSGK